MIKNIKHNRFVKSKVESNTIKYDDDIYVEKKKKKLPKLAILVFIITVALITLFFLLQDSHIINEAEKINDNHIPVYLFIFNYHWNNYVNYPFIKDIYIPYIRKTFKYKSDFVFYGPSKSDIYPIKGNDLEENGVYSYYALVKAYNDTSVEYDGYFFLNDDSFFDPVVFNRINISLKYTIVEGMGAFEANNTEWLWPAAYNYRGITFKQAYINVRNKICGENFTKYLKLCNFDVNKNFHGYADFFYIPNSLIKDYVYLFDLAYKEGMFLEMAVNSLMYNSDFQELGKKCYFIHEIGDCPHVHPIKFSDYENKRIVRHYIIRVLKSLEIT